MGQILGLCSVKCRLLFCTALGLKNDSIDDPGLRQFQSIELSSSLHDLRQPYPNKLKLHNGLEENMVQLPHNYH